MMGYTFPFLRDRYVVCLEQNDRLLLVVNARISSYQKVHGGFREGNFVRSVAKYL